MTSFLKTDGSRLLQLNHGRHGCKRIVFCLWSEFSQKCMIHIDMYHTVAKNASKACPGYGT